MLNKLEQYIFIAHVQCLEYVLNCPTESIYAMNINFDVISRTHCINVHSTYSAGYSYIPVRGQFQWSRATQRLVDVDVHVTAQHVLRI